MSCFLILQRDPSNEMDITLMINLIGTPLYPTRCLYCCRQCLVVTKVVRLLSLPPATKKELAAKKKQAKNVKVQLQFKYIDGTVEKLLRPEYLVRHFQVITGLLKALPFLS